MGPTHHPLLVAPASVPSPGCPAPGPRHEPAAAEVPTPAPASSAVETGDTVAADICCHLAGVLAWVLGVGDKETCVQQFSFPQQTSSGPVAVAGGGRPSTTTTTTGA